MARMLSEQVGGPTILTVPGLGGSGPSHWQTLWEGSRPNAVRADLGLWDHPHRNAWVTKLDAAIRTARAPVVLVAHSLGCLAVAWWAELAGQPYGWPVAGALLVAPPDVDAASAPAEIASFAPAPTRPLPFPSLLVGSSDDPWCSPERIRSLAASWGSTFVDAGAQGHLNAASGHGWWPEGQELLARVLAVAGHDGGASLNPGDARTMLRAGAGSQAAAHPR
jgi:uncharacterized protein